GHVDRNSLGGVAGHYCGGGRRTRDNFHLYGFRFRHWAFFPFYTPAVARFFTVAVDPVGYLSGVRGAVQFRLWRLRRGPHARTSASAGRRRDRIPRWHAWRGDVGTCDP